ncbi:MAG: 30S ribosomal protein S8 [Myxococcota bacterium]
MVTDPIADLLTRIRNAQKAGHASLAVPHSKMKQRVAEILQDEGYLTSVAVEGQGPGRKINIQLKYDQERKGVIDGLERVSKPGLRIYRGHADLEQVRGGMGMSILSTSQGVMSDKDARSKKVGGEVLCKVW